MLIEVCPECKKLPVKRVVHVSPNGYEVLECCGIEAPTIQLTAEQNWNRIVRYRNLQREVEELKKGVQESPEETLPE